jgi:hypothetical protein
VNADDVHVLTVGAAPEYVVTQLDVDVQVMPENASHPCTDGCGYNVHVAPASSETAESDSD